MRAKHAWAAILVAATIGVTAESARGDDAKTDADVQRRLEQQKVTLSQDGTPLEEALGALHDATGIAFALDAGAAKLISDERLVARCRVRDVAVKNALERILAASAELEFEVWQATVFISRSSRKSAKPAAFALSAEEKKALAEKKVTCAFNETPIADVVRFLSDSSGRTISVADGLNDRKLTLRVKDHSAESVLVVVCRALELTAVSDGNKIELRSAPVPGEAPLDPGGMVWKKADPKKAALEKKLATQRVTLNFDDTPLSEVASFLHDMAGVDVTLDKGLDGDATKVTVQLQNATVKAALDQVAAKARCAWEIVDGAVVFKKK